MSYSAKMALSSFVAFAQIAATQGAAEDPRARIRVDLTHPLGEISPGIFGHFTELLLSSYHGSLCSELLANRKFGQRRHEGGGASLQTAAAWDALSYDTYVSLRLVEDVCVSPPFAQKISRFEGAREPAGIYQSGKQVVFPRREQGQTIEHPFVFKRGESYAIRMHARQEALTGPLVVALGASAKETIAEHRFHLQGNGWQVLECTLTPAADLEDGRFMVFIDSPGQVWVDSVSMRRPDQSEGLLRKDALAYIREQVRPTNLRFPGGCFADDYVWQEGIGPVDERPDVLNRAWEAYHDNDIGTDEFIAFCRSVNAEPYLCVNYGNATPADAAAWVEYCNGSPATHWGAIRAKNGHAEPYGVKYWNIGNEIYLAGEIGGTNGREYGRRFKEYAHAMRAVDPTIQLVAVGCYDYPPERAEQFREDPPMLQGMRYGVDFTKQLLEEAADEIDVLSIHFYEPNVIRPGHETAVVDQASMAIGEILNNEIDRLYRLIRETAPQREHLPIALDEWANWFRDNRERKLPEEIPELESPSQYGLHGVSGNLRTALSEASILNLMQRRPKDFVLGNKTILSCFAAGEVGISRDAVIASPPGLMMGMFSSHEPCQALPVDVGCASFDIPPIDHQSVTRGFAEGMKGVKELDVSARLRPDGKTLELFVLNRNLEQPVQVQIECPPRPGSVARAFTLQGDDLLDVNTFARPGRVRVETKDLPVPKAEYQHEFPPASLTKLVLEISR